MAISVNWITGVISVPRNDMTLVQSNPTEIRQLDLNQFRLTLRDLEDDPDGGRPYPTTHKHNTELNVGGVELARTIQILDYYTVTFEDGQYAVNLVGANSNVGDRVNVNQVSIRSANSAGLVSSQAIEFGEYGGGVTIDTANGFAGAIYPIGTLRKPSNNVSDTLDILAFRGFAYVYIRDYLFLDSGDFSSGKTFSGQNASVSAIILNDLTNVSDCEFEKLTVSGVADDSNVIQDCLVLDITSYDGYIRNSGLAGTITLGGISDTVILGCDSLVAGAQGTPIIDFNHTASGLAMRDYDGGIKLINKTNATGNISIDLNSGQCIIDLSSCNAGTITVRGVGKVIDQNGNHLMTGNYGGLSVNNECSYGQHIHDIWGQIVRTVFVNTELADNGNGYQNSPFNAWTNAVDYVESEALTSMTVLADATIDRPLKSFDIIGRGVPAIDCNGQNLNKTSFVKCLVEGVYIGQIIAQASKLRNTNINGNFENCGLLGALTAVDGGEALIKDCSILSPVTVDMVSGANSKLIISKITGDITILNCTGTDYIEVAMDGGTLTLDASCTGGIIKAKGECDFINNANGTAVTDKTHLGLTVSQHMILNNIYEVLGLDPESPIQVGDGAYLSNNINIVVTDNGDGTATLERQ